MSLDITLLTDQQIRGDKQGNGQLQVMKSYGTKTGASDLAVLLGGAVSSSNTTSEGKRSACVWSVSPHRGGDVSAVHDSGDRDCHDTSLRYLGARPALPSSVASSIGLREAKPSRKIYGVDGTEIDVVEYGEYPQTIAFADLEPEKAQNNIAALEQAFQNKQLQETGKIYNFDSEKRDACDKPFNAKEHAEYQHKGKKYVRVEAKPYGGGRSFLSNGKTPQTGEVYWVEVQPIEWLRDPSGICVARQALFAGVQFDSNTHYSGNFAKTDMHRYLQTHFAKEMLVNPELDKFSCTVDMTSTSQTVAENLTSDISVAGVTVVPQSCEGWTQIVLGIPGTNKEKGRS